MKLAVIVAFFFLDMVISFKLIPTVIFPTWRSNSILWYTVEEAFSRAENLLKNSNNENIVFNVALEIMRYEDKLSLEKKLSEQKLSLEKELSEQKLSIEKELSEHKLSLEKELSEHDFETDKKLIRSYFEKELSFVVQSAALEKVFEQVRYLLFETDVLSYLSTLFPAGFDFQRQRESISGISTVLQNKEARLYLFGRMNCTYTEEFPISDLFRYYELLSELVHRPLHKEILVSDKEDSQTKRFWKCIALWCKKRYKEYDEMYAVLGEDIVNKKNLN